MEFSVLSGINADFVSLQDLYGPEKVPLSALVRFFFPQSTPIKYNNNAIDGSSHEKETRFILRLFIKYHELLKAYGKVPSGLEARNWLVENKDINWWTTNRDCLGKRPDHVGIPLNPSTRVIPKPLIQDT